jgi:hypothetical protein
MGEKSLNASRGQRRRGPEKQLRRLTLSMEWGTSPLKAVESGLNRFVHRLIPRKFTGKEMISAMRADKAKINSLLKTARGQIDGIL